MEEIRDISIPANISLRKSQLKFIDNYRINHGYKNRSHYISFLIDKDIKYNRLDNIAELMGLIILPVMGFFFFMVLAVLTRGMLFYLFMAVFGIFAIALSFLYYAKHKIPKVKDWYNMYDMRLFIIGFIVGFVVIQLYLNYKKKRKKNET